MTVAGAALLQRVATAVTKLGGNVLSSQVELEGTEAKNGYIGLIASCEIEQPALQQLLYDLEAGMPFLFVDQLVAQAPVPTTAGKAASACGYCSRCPDCGRVRNDRTPEHPGCRLCGKPRALGRRGGADAAGVDVSECRS